MVKRVKKSGVQSGVKRVKGYGKESKGVFFFEAVLEYTAFPLPYSLYPLYPLYPMPLLTFSPLTMPFLPFYPFGIRGTPLSPSLHRVRRASG